MIEGSSEWAGAVESALGVGAVEVAGGNSRSALVDVDAGTVSLESES